MTLTAHIKTLEDRKAKLEADIDVETNRPLPDFATIKKLKTQKLRVKERIYLLTHPQFDYDCA